MSIRSFLLFGLGSMLLTLAGVAQEKPDDPRWSIRTYVVPTDGTVPQARPNPDFVPNTTPRVIQTPYELLVVEPNIRPRPNTGRHQAEVDIKAWSVNRNVMFGASHNFVSGSINVATFITTDGGVTWYGRDTLSDLNTQRGDPAPIIDKNGTFIYGHLNSATNFGSVTGMAANYSTDRGLTWSASIPIPGTTSNVDKELLGTDDSPSSPYYGNTYMAWTLFTAGSFPATIYFSKTTDGGVSWSTAQQINTAGASTFSQGTDVAVATDGTVYVCWNEESRTSPYPSTSLGFAKSTDGGTTWTFNNAVYATTGIRNNSSFNGWGVRVNDFPRMSIDKTGGSRNGWIYVVAPEINRAPAGTDADIVFHRSTDGGATWSAGVRVNQDALNNGKSQFFPAITVDQGGGINVCYYDNRNYPSSADSCEFYMSRSLDGGNTWVDIKVSDHAFRPKSAPGVSAFMGDYVGIAAGNGKVWPMWQDDRSGFYDVWTSGIQTTEGFGWIKGTVSNISGGAPLSNVVIDFMQSIPQAQGLSNASGFYVAGARVDTPGTTVNLTLRARKFGFLDTTLAVTLTRNDTLTRNFSMRALDLVLTKSSITFPPTPAPGTSRDSLVARNQGTTPINLSSLTSTNPRFTVSPTSGVIAGGDTLKIRVTYTPLTGGTDTGRVIVLSNSTFNPRLDILLNGTAIGVPRFTASVDSVTKTLAGHARDSVIFRVRNVGTAAGNYGARAVIYPRTAARERTSQPIVIPMSLKKMGGSGVENGVSSLLDYVIPPNYANTSGGSTFNGQLTNSARTYQWLIRDSLLTGLIGQRLTGIRFRLPPSVTTPWPAADVTYSNYDIYLSGSVTPANRSLTFAQNVVGPQTLVRSGSLTIPAGSYTTGGNPNAFGPEITFTNPWQYTGGHLLIELRHNGFSGTAAAVDAIGTAVTGYGSAFSACWTGSYTGTSGSQGNFAIINLTPGGGAWFSVTPTSGTLAQNDSISMVAKFDATDSLIYSNPGNYFGRIEVFATNSALADTLKVPARLLVTPSTGVGSFAYQIPGTFELQQNYPNPFNPTTTIKFSLPQESRVRLIIYNILGQEVIALSDEIRPAGHYDAIWDGTTNGGLKASSGVYFYRMEATGKVTGERYTSLKKMVLLK